VIPDRIIEPNTLSADGSTCTVEVRIPWYRALPASCVSGVSFAVDGVAAPAESLRWTMNGTTYRLDDLVGRTDEWWFPTDSVAVSGEISLSGTDVEHQVDIGLQLYIPYIVTDHGVLRIEEHDTKTMKASR